MRLDPDQFTSDEKRQVVAWLQANGHQTGEPVLEDITLCDGAAHYHVPVFDEDGHMKFAREGVALEDRVLPVTVALPDAIASKAHRLMGEDLDGVHVTTITITHAMGDE